MQYQFTLPHYRPILAVFVEQRLSQRMPFDSIDRNEPQKFIGEICYDHNWSEMSLVMNEQEEKCLFTFTYADPKVLLVIKKFENEITEIWKGYNVK